MATQIPQAPQVPQLGSSTFEEDMKAFHQWEKEQLQPNVNQLAQEVENNANTTQSLKNETEQLKNETQSLKDETDQLKSECEQIKNDIQTIIQTAQFQGDWQPEDTYSKGDSVRYDDRLWISLVDNNKNNIPENNSNYWVAICGGFTKTPIIQSSDINENSIGTHIISNYDSDATYHISWSDALIKNITINENEIVIETEDITDDINHSVSYSIYASKEGYLDSSVVTVNFNILYVELISDSAILLSAETYNEDNLLTISDGEVI